MPGHDLAPLARLDARVDPRHLFRIRRDGGLDQQPLERMIEIPVIDDVLVVPDDLAGVGVERERGVVVEVRLVVARQRELRRGNRHRRADEDPVQLRVVARHHPRAHVPALRHRHVAPGLVAGLARQRNRARAPHLLAGCRVVRGDDAGVVAGVGLALAPGDHLAVGDDRPGARARALLRLHHRRFPHHVAGVDVDGVDLIVGAAVDERAAPHRDVAVGAAVDAFRQLAAVLPHQVAGLRVDRRDDVARAGHVHHAVVDERRRFDVARAEAARPHHLDA